MSLETTMWVDPFKEASPRLRAAARLWSWDISRVCDPAVLERQLAEASLPVWPWLIDFEARFGGLNTQYVNFGLGPALNPGLKASGRPLCSAGAKTPRHRSKSGANPKDEHTWMVIVGVQDRDTGVYGDEAGHLFWVRPPFSPPRPWSADADHFFEHLALSRELQAQRRAAHADVWLEVEGEVGAALAEEFVLPEIVEASDAVTRFWWDGELCVQEASSLCEPPSRATRLESTDLNRLIAAGKRAYQLANKGRKRPLQPRLPPTTPERMLRVVGYAPESYVLARQLKSLKRVGSVRVTGW